jgi:branched-chain amino acid transport system substrate-binding protein
MAAAALAAGMTVALRPLPAWAQNEQFIPGLVYRTGAYAPNGIPFADGAADYISLLNARDGGINGVKIAFEECETGYATDRGVECYERLKGKGATGAAYFSPLSTGITFALTEKAPGDKIPLITMGYGRSESPRRCGVHLELPAARHLLDSGQRAVQHIAKELGGSRQAQGQEDRAPLSRFALRQGADRGARRHGEEVRLRVPADPGRGSRAASRSRSGCKSASSGPTTCCCGAGA